jgi:hypothetical protein
MTVFSKHPAKALVAAFALLFAQSGFADITLQVNLGGDLPVADGTVGVLVVDRAGDGFLSPDHVSAVGSQLSPGQQIGLGDDLIIGVLQSSSTEFAGGSGFVGVLAGIDYAAMQLAEGQPMIFYWFPGITTPGTVIPTGANYESFRATSPSNVPSSIGFDLPADPGVYDLAYLDPGNGGNISIGNPGGGGDHDSGTVGSDDSPLPSGGDSRIDPVTDPQPNPGFTGIDWQPDAPGTYYGLITGPGGRIHGEILVRASKTGSLSATITLDGVRYRYAGALPVVGGLIPRPKTGEPDLVLDLDFFEDDTTGGYSLIGTLDDDGTTLNINADHNPSKRGGGPAMEAGNYTIALPAPGGVGQTILPAGDGVGTASVRTNGAVRALLTLGDGTRASDSGFLSQDSEWDIYVPLYRGKGEGFLAGHVSLRDTENIADADSPLHWKKGPEPRPRATSCYPLGFETSLNLVGARFDAPRKGAPLLHQFVDMADNANLLLEGGDLDPTIDPKLLTWDMNNKVSHDGSAAGEVIRIRPSTRNGAVNGTFQKRYINGDGKRVTQKVAFVGVALQKQGIIVGNFKGNNGLTGLLTIESTGMPSLTVRDDDGNAIANGAVFDFDDTGIDGPGSERIVEIENTGTGNLYIDGNPSVDDPAFGLSTVRWGYLEPGDTTRVRVRFAPNTVGGFAGTLAVRTNDRANNPFILNMTGQGIAGTASNVESGDDRDNQVGTPGAPPIPADFNPAPFDAVNAAGNYGGNLTEDGTVPIQVGNGAIRVKGDTTAGTGVFSGSLKVGRDTGRVVGTIDAAGAITITAFSGKLAAKYDLEAVLVENLDGDYAISGILTPLGDDPTLSFLFGHYTYSRSNPTAWEGRYTMVIPANEDLGAGYPSGDGVALVTVKSDGKITAAAVMADGERTGIKGQLTDEDIWQVFQAWKRGSIGGIVHFRDEPGISDFDGDVLWDRPADARAKSFHEGFQVETTALGSSFKVPDSGMTIVGGFVAGPDNATVTLDGIDPLVGDRDATLSDTNALTVTPANASERIAIRVNSRTGSVAGIFRRAYDDNGKLIRETIKCTGVAFQKQDIITGSCQTGAQAGFFGVISGGGGGG